MPDFALLLLVGLALASCVLRLLDHRVRSRAAAGRPPLNRHVETALHWLICVAAMVAVFVLGAILAL
jgi:hypothetical protein